MSGRAALGRCGVVLAATGAAAHGALALADPTAAGVAMVPLALGCLWCARHLWRDPAPRAWAACLVLDGAMVAVMLLAHAAAGATGGVASVDPSVWTSVEVLDAHHGSPGSGVLDRAGGGAMATTTAMATRRLMAAAEALVVLQLALAAAALGQFTATAQGPRSQGPRSQGPRS